MRKRRADRVVKKNGWSMDMLWINHEDVAAAIGLTLHVMKGPDRRETSRRALIPRTEMCDHPGNLNADEDPRPCEMKEDEPNRRAEL